MVIIHEVDLPKVNKLQAPAKEKAKGKKQPDDTTGVSSEEKRSRSSQEQTRKGKRGKRKEREKETKGIH